MLAARSHRLEQVVALATTLTVLLATCSTWHAQFVSADSSATFSTTKTIHAVERGPFTQLQAVEQATTAAPALSDDAKKLLEFKRSPLYIPPFDESVPALPDIQREFVNEQLAKNFDLFRRIMREAIDKKNTFAPSVGLMFKYSGKLLGNFIAERRAEQKISPRVEPKLEFFNMIAHLIEHVLDRSSKIKSEKGYTKTSVNTDELYERFDRVLAYMDKVVHASPVAAYFRWNEMILFRGDGSKPESQRDIVEEMADLTAQFRAIGYDKCMFVARRIINLLNMFSKGHVPSEKEV